MGDVTVCAGKLLYSNLNCFWKYVQELLNFEMIRLIYFEAASQCALKNWHQSFSSYSKLF